MSVYNEAKYETLDYIDRNSFATGHELADYRGVTHGCQSTLLRRYWRDGLLHRLSGEGKEKIYTLSTRGIERLDFLKDQFEEVYDEQPDNYVTEYLSLVKRCRVKKDENVTNFLKDIKRCRIIRSENNYLIIERE